jgi:hypothetical protein
MSFYKDYLEKKEKSLDKDQAPDLIGSNKEAFKESDKNSKISMLQEKEEREREDFLNRVSGKKIEPNELVVKMGSEPKEPKIEDLTIPAKQGKVKKFIIRFIFFIIILLLISALTLVSYNFYTSRKHESLTSLVKSEEEIDFSYLIEKPNHLINYHYFEYPIVEDKEKIINIFSSYINRSFPVSSLVRITFLDENNRNIDSSFYLDDFILPLIFTLSYDTDLDNSILSLESMLIDNIDLDSFNLFINYKENGNDFGFIVKANDFFTSIIKELEDEIDLSDNIFNLTEEDQFIMCKLLQLEISGKTITNPCYSIIEGNLFLVTTSLETMNIAIDNLKK